MTPQQNINLLTELTLQPVSALNSRLIIQLCVGWVLLLALIYLITLGVISKKEQALAALETTQKNLNATIAIYSQTLVLAQRRAPTNLQILPPGSGSLVGFYHYLEDLAKYTPHGVWLNYLYFSEIDNSITLEGSTVAASGVSALLQALDNSALRDKKFSTLQLQYDPQTNNTNFIISTIDAHLPSNNTSNFNTTGKASTADSSSFANTDLTMTTNKKP